MVSAVHLSAIRSSTSRDGQRGSRTDGTEEAFGMTRCVEQLRYRCKSESNAPEDVYGSDPRVVDCWLRRSKFKHEQYSSHRKRRRSDRFLIQRDRLRRVTARSRWHTTERLRVARRVFAHGC